MKRFRLLLLDANVVIYLWKSGLWDAVVEQCELVLGRIVFDEAHFWEDDDGGRHDFDLKPYEPSRIQVVAVDAQDARDFLNLFQPGYVEDLDPGELELLALMYREKEQPYLVCSADAIVPKVLVNLQMQDRCISLEEILQQLGLGRKLPSMFSRDRRDKWERDGFADMMQGRGVRKMP